MKTYLRIAVLSVVAAAVLFTVYLVRQASVPQSAIIAMERYKIYASRDKGRMESDRLYALDIQEKLDFLDYRLAVACNAEDKPDEAITVLQKLINNEEAKGKSGTPRRARSYLNEARYYEALKESYDLKRDEAGGKAAVEQRAELMTRAAEAGRRESSGEGKSVGSSGE